MQIYPSFVDQRMGAAFHEIGHSILCVLFDMPMSKISIYKAFLSTGYGGQVATNWKSLGSAEEVDLLTMIYLGGQEAQSMWIVNEYGYELDEARAMTNMGARSDRKMIRLLEQFNEVSTPTLRTRVHSILRDRWSTLERLSPILAERKRISPGTVKANTGNRAGTHIRQFETLDLPTNSAA